MVVGLMRPTLSNIPRWVLIPALAAPVVLIGGWTVGAWRQPSTYSPMRQTISALSQYGAQDRMIMTLCLAALGLSFVVMSFGFRAASLAGRIALALGGVAMTGAAIFPQPVHGSSNAHLTSAGFAFVLLAIWPALGARRDSRALLNRQVSIVTSLTLLILAGVFTLVLGSADVGLSERIMAGTEAVWPLAVIASLRSRCWAGPATMGAPATRDRTLV
jgi:hypothetical membrane protein